MLDIARSRRILNLALPIMAAMTSQSLINLVDTLMVGTLGVQWFLFLPAAYIIGPVLGHGLLGVWILQAIQRLVTSCLLGWLWHRRHWIHIQL